MKLSVRFIGKTIVELKIEGWVVNLEEDVAGIKGEVPFDLIQNLRDVADEMEMHNNEIMEALKNNEL